MAACVKSSKLFVSIKIDIQSIKIRVSNKQQVHDQKWDIGAQTIVHVVGNYKMKNNENGTNKHVRLSMIEDIIK